MFNFSRISKEDLEVCSKRGLIVGPNETEEQFIQRVEKLNALSSNPPAQCDHFLTDTDWIRPFETTRALYNIAPDWIVGYYSDAKLPLYQGAATWIEEKQGIRLPLIQLKKRFSYEKSALRSDILSHEAIHAARLQFDEPYFEEHFAYRTSRKWLRRFFGPLFQKNWEALVFILLFFLPLGSEIARFYLPEVWVLDFVFFIPWCFTGLLLLRLFSCHALFALAKRRLSSLALMLHLTDREILKLALTPKRFKGDHSLRWRQINATFSFEKPKGS